MMRSCRALPWVVLAVAFCGCNNSSATAAGVTPSTAVAVDPEEFLGSIACSDAPGGMRLYVATLTDVSPRNGTGLDDAQQLVLPSSLPTSCHVKVLFESILDGRQYAAQVDGYDRDDVVPIAPGSNVLVDPTTRTYVTPRWTTRCAYRLLPPALSTDGQNHDRDAGRPVRYAPPTPGDIVSTFVDGGYGWCAPVPLYGNARIPWLDGPVCAVNQQTITARGCDPLRE